MKRIYAHRCLDSGSAQSMKHYSGFVECNVGVRETVDITYEEESWEALAQLCGIAISEYMK